MDKREKYLIQLKSYTEVIDNELTMILQSLQWDRNNLIKGTSMAICKYDQSHRLPLGLKEEHENTCFYKQQGYSSNDMMLPDPLDNNSSTLVKLKNEDITQILEAASKLDSSFKKVFICVTMYNYILFVSRGPEPASLSRMQAAYSADERRAIHDAVVSAVPSCHDLADLALLSANGEEQQGGKSKSRVEILAELRDMRRRRAKYRGAAKTRNYSDILRDLIKTQMEFYTDAQSSASIATPEENMAINKHMDNSKQNEHNNDKQKRQTDYHRSTDYRHAFQDRDTRWSSKQRHEGSNESERYISRSRDKRHDGREEFTKRKYEGRDNFKESYNCKDEGKSDRNRNKDSSRDRGYDISIGSIKTEVEERHSGSSQHRDGRSHRTDEGKHRSKRKYESRESVTREDGSKYDKYKSRDSKRRYDINERTSSYGRRKGIEGGPPQEDEKYTRYYDVSNHKYHNKIIKSEK